MKKKTFEDYWRRSARFAEPSNKPRSQRIDAGPVSYTHLDVYKRQRTN